MGTRNCDPQGHLIVNVSDVGEVVGAELGLELAAGVAGLPVGVCVGTFVADADFGCPIERTFWQPGHLIFLPISSGLIASVRLHPGHLIWVAMEIPEGKREESMRQQG
ncbi:hypothetical protein [Stieleria varia]|uniref:hypothetical protein n=1 Tax=Stieleria varia TaxID=2528005 RepID=UPI0018D20A34|nr:hypothetical protein [Stieleria varia]